MKDYNYSRLAKYYDIVETNESVNEFNEVLDKLLKKMNIKEVLDISCGTGLQSIALAKKGYKVTASDINGSMLKVAKEKAKREKINIEFRQGDMRNAKQGKFDAVISIYNSIGHLTKKDFEKAIRNIRENLKDEGVFIFDIFNLDFMKTAFIAHEFIDKSVEFDDMKFVRFNKNSFDSDKGLMSMNQKTYIQKGMDKPEVTKESWDMQIYNSDELKNILEKNGFEVVDFLDMNGNKFDKDKSVFILTVARKK